jgi:predicted nucleotidyltransferase
MEKIDNTLNEVKDLKLIKGILNEQANSIKINYKAEVIGIFGSYSRGEQKRGSDLDILVKFNEGASLFDFVGLADFLEEKLNLKVDIVSERAIREELKDQIFNEVVKI